MEFHWLGWSTWLINTPVLHFISCKQPRVGETLLQQGGVTCSRFSRISNSTAGHSRKTCWVCGNADSGLYTNKQTQKVCNPQLVYQRWLRIYCNKGNPFKIFSLVGSGFSSISIGTVLSFSFHIFRLTRNVIEFRIIGAFCYDIFLWLRNPSWFRSGPIQSSPSSALNCAQSSYCQLTSVCCRYQPKTPWRLQDSSVGCNCAPAELHQMEAANTIMFSIFHSRNSRCRHRVCCHCWFFCHLAGCCSWEPEFLFCCSHCGWWLLSLVVVITVVKSLLVLA